MTDHDKARAAYDQGRADGAAGDRIDQAARLDPATGADYGRGLQDGRTEQVDAELLTTTTIGELERRLIEAKGDPIEHARIRGLIRRVGFPELAAELDRIAIEAELGEYSEDTMAAWAGHPGSQDAKYDPPVRHELGFGWHSDGPGPLGTRLNAVNRMAVHAAQPVEVECCRSCRHAWLAHYDGGGCLAGGPCTCSGYVPDPLPIDG